MYTFKVRDSPIIARGNGIDARILHHVLTHMFPPSRETNLQLPGMG